MFFKIIPENLRLWIRSGIPKRKATFKDLLDGLKNQAATAALFSISLNIFLQLIKLSAGWMLFFYILAIGLSALGALFLLILTSYQTVYSFEESSFFIYIEKRKAKKNYWRLLYIFWVLPLIFSIGFAGLNVFSSKFYSW